MNGMFYLPFLFVLPYLAIVFILLYLVYKWVNKFISLKQEQNDLLREIVKKLDNK